MRASTKFTSGGPYAGLQPPIALPGKIILPPHCSYNQATMSVTSGRYYAVPFPISRLTTFAGVKFYNSGTGDSGHKVKVAMFSEGANGGLGALAKNFGEATLGATAAIDTLASSWTPSVTGIYYLVFAANAAASVATMESLMRSSAAGYFAPNQLVLMNSVFPADLLGVAISNGGYIGDYVDGTYANFPEANGLTLTNSVMAIVTPSGTGAFPLMGLYE